VKPVAQQKTKMLIVVGVFARIMMNQFWHRRRVSGIVLNTLVVSRGQRRRRADRAGGTAGAGSGVNSKHTGRWKVDRAGRGGWNR